jgi:hypothetical protein
MGNRISVLLLLVAASVWGQSLWTDPIVRPGQAEPLWFRLTETRDEVGALLGKPAQVAEFGAGFYSWQYQIASGHEDYSHYAVFRKSDGKLISITREYDPQRNVDGLFPEAETKVCVFEGPGPPYSARVRRLSGGRVLMAMGVSKAGQVTGQLVLIRESELKNFYPWVRP